MISPRFDLNGTLMKSDRGALINSTNANGYLGVSKELFERSYKPKGPDT
ncbi:MAG: hypothetical protein QXY37_03220 [Metallosphaera sp.]